ncbi:rhamnogalacturonan acetylesterase [Actinoplanes regularis]|uniref:rhamnogalacturonan acetylesterase n=1 Tax=Actinoplanes regularis TaxID=52697 RepID=UPI0024A437A6|nr:rhamnogalacturonan acetylesterase [Actinoplanes regularis]GLW35675.1 rhamnogalacturonan acetylesterase [Actinoplanes regularis]
MKRFRGSSLILALTSTTIALPSPASASPAIPVTCTGSSPIVCHADLPPGNYDVAVTLGAPDVAASTAVRAEARRMMVSEVATEAGRFAHRRFGVNVREPEGEPTKAGSGTAGLTLTFTGAAPAVRNVTVRPSRPHRPMLYLAGDSTVCDQDTFPYTGWGQAVPQHLPGMTVANYADSGESSGSFLADPLLFATMAPLLHRGDVVLLQFGHNDKQTTAEDYRANLTSLVAGVRERHARPILVSPPVRRIFGGDGKLTPVALHVNGLGVDLPAEMERVAAELDVPYINLTADSAALVEGLGPTDSQPIYLYRELKDNTHFSEYGADVIGRLVLTRLGPLLSRPADQR